MTSWVDGFVIDAVAMDNYGDNIRTDILLGVFELSVSSYRASSDLHGNGRAAMDQHQVTCASGRNGLEDRVTTEQQVRCYLQFTDRPKRSCRQCRAFGER